jgi:subtilisin
MHGKQLKTLMIKPIFQALGLLLLWATVAFPADKSVIIGFHDNNTNDPVGGPAMAAEPVELGASCNVYYRYLLIPAVAATMPEEEIATLRENPAIAYVEENAVYTAAATLDDGAELDNSWQVPHVLAHRAHASGNLGTGVRVAVLDTGIDYNHEDLDDNYLGGIDFVHDDLDPLDDSYFGHGTHVSGIIAAERNGMGVVGIAPGAKLYAVKVLDGAGFGNADWIIAGIEWAVFNGADIINMSLAGPDREGLREACDAARRAGVLLVAAGGNSLAGGAPVEYPAAYSSVIAVTGTDRDDQPGYFAPLGGLLELAAPGVDILSTTVNGEYRTLDGTSQAAACVSGVAALYFASLATDLNFDGAVDHKDVRQMLRLTSRELGAAGKDEQFGYGLVDALLTSFVPSTVLTIVETRGDDTRAAELDDALYGITLANLHLRYVRADVFEGEIYRDDLSRTIRFGRNGLVDAFFWLDARGTTYTIQFTPIGSPGTLADIIIERESN